MNLQRAQEVWVRKVHPGLNAKLSARRKRNDPQADQVFVDRAGFGLLLSTNTVLHDHFLFELTGDRIDGDPVIRVTIATNPAIHYLFERGTFPDYLRAMADLGSLTAKWAPEVDP